MSPYFSSWADFFYDREKLKTLQDFTHEHTYITNQRLNYRQIIRKFFIVILFTEYLIFPLFFNWKRFIFSFTHWNLIITHISIYLTFNAAKDTINFKRNFDKCENYQQAFKKVVVHHLFYSATFIMNLMVVTIYWIYLHDKAIVYYKTDEVSRILPVTIYQGRMFYLYTVHIIPGIACLINVLITNCVLKINIFGVISFIGVIYGIVNYIFSKKTGIILYWFLDHRKGLITYGLNLTIIIITAFIAYFIICKIERIFKRDLGKKKVE